MKDSDWQILQELYRTKNITRAAERLFITQPSLTKRLKAIEAEFQVTVVNRTKKGVEFTPEGEFLAQKAGEYSLFLSGVRKGLREMQGSGNTVISLGTSYTFSRNELPGILVEYSTSHPHVTFDIHTEQSNLLFRKVCDGELDAAFVRGDYDGDVEQRRLTPYQGYLVTRRLVNLSDLTSMDRLEYQTNDRTTELIAGWWSDHFGTGIPDAPRVGYLDVAFQLIDQGENYYTIAFMPGSVKNRQDRVYEPLYYRDGRPLIRNTWFVFRDSRNMPAPIREFIRYIENNILDFSAEVC